MMEPQTIGDYATLMRTLRARVAELGITHETLDDLAGFQSGYASKLLCDPPMKRLGPITLHIMFGALAMRQQLVHDEEAYGRLQHRLERRLKPRMLRARRTTVHLTPDFMRRIAILGNAARTKKLSPAKRSRLARKAAKARWAKPRVTEVRGPATCSAAQGDTAPLSRL